MPDLGLRESGAGSPQQRGGGVARGKAIDARQARD